MPSLFIANTSSKHNEFVFRLPGISQLRRLDIPAGRQLEVLKNVQKDEIDYVVNQHIAYGLIHVSEISKICKFSGMIYSIDKPVPSNAMNQVMEINADILIEQGHELRKVAAVATNATIEDMLENKLNLKELEVVEIEQEDTGKKPLLKEKIAIDKSKRTRK
jgi:hypothetical protein